MYTLRGVVTCHVFNSQWDWRKGVMWQKSYVCVKSAHVHSYVKIIIKTSSDALFGVMLPYKGKKPNVWRQGRVQDALTIIRRQFKNLRTWALEALGYFYTSILWPLGTCVLEVLGILSTLDTVALGNLRKFEYLNGTRALGHLRQLGTLRNF